MGRIVMPGERGLHVCLRTRRASAAPSVTGGAGRAGSREGGIVVEVINLGSVQMGKEMEGEGDLKEG